MRSDDEFGRDRGTFCRGAEGERRSSQAKGPDSDDTPKSAFTHAEGATRCDDSGGESLRQSTEAQSSKGSFVPLF